MHFVTGHTHLSFNVTPEDDVTGGREVYEHNAGAIALRVGGRATLLRVCTSVLTEHRADTRYGM